MDFQILPIIPFMLLNRRKDKVYKLRRSGDENNFKQMFRFTRNNVDFLARKFLPEYTETRGGALTNVNKMRCFLRYIGDPGFQVGVGEDVGIHQSTVSKTNWYVCQKILEKADDWIRFPSNSVELESEKKKWQRKFYFPGAIGAIDCTHILIKKPTLHGDEYVNRKNLASFNVQATCDGNEMFTSVNCQWPGSVHDSRIWRNSSIRMKLNENSEGAILLGDEGYPLTPWLMTPFRNPRTRNEINFNIVHTRERCIIERMFGQVKQRFPILLSKIRLRTERIPSIIVACFVLHNVAKFLGDPDFEITETEDAEIHTVPEIQQRNVSIFHRGKKRKQAIANYMQERQN